MIINYFHLQRANLIELLSKNQSMFFNLNSGKEKP